jgi:hypothetical protein
MEKNEMEWNGMEWNGTERKREANTKKNQNHIMIEYNDMIDCAIETKERERQNNIINDVRLTVKIKIMGKNYNERKIEEISMV